MILFITINYFSGTQSMPLPYTAYLYKKIIAKNNFSFFYFPCQLFIQLLLCEEKCSMQRWLNSEVILQNV